MGRDAFEGVGGLDETLGAGQDWDLWARLGATRQMVAVYEPGHPTPGDAEQPLDDGRPDAVQRRKDAGDEPSQRPERLRPLVLGRRTWSAELSRCAIIAREENDSRSLPLLLRSLGTSSGSDGPYSLRLSDALPIG
jgi:hypothetical protein